MHIPGTYRSPPEVLLSELKLDPSVLPAPAPIGQAADPARNVLRNWVPPPFASAEKAAIDCAALQVETVESVEALAAFEAQWQSLADEALEPNPFYEPWMLLPVLRHLPGQSPLFVLIWAPHPSGRKGERLLCGLFPLREEPLVPRLGARSPRVLSLWKHPYCYLTAPLLRKGVPRETLGTFFNWLSQSGRAAHSLLKLQEFPAEGPVAQAWVDVTRQQGWSSWQAETFTRAFFRPAPTAERFFETAVAGRRRKEWRRLASRLSEQGGLEVEELELPEDLRAWTDSFAELEASGWKGRKGVAVASRAADRRFFQELCRHAHLRDRLQLLALKVGGRRIAMKMNLFTRDGAGFAFKITYDEAYAKYSPGVLLELENIQRLHARSDLPWMDSCAAPTRFMINQLWPERRQLQSVFLAGPGAATGLALSILPLVRWARAQVRQLRQNRAQSPEESHAAQ